MAEDQGLTGTSISGCRLTNDAKSDYRYPERHRLPTICAMVTVVHTAFNNST